MQPDDLSLPRGDNRIKAKLNLHVKKRLQETAKSSSLPATHQPPTPPASSSASSSSSSLLTSASPSGSTSAAAAPPPPPGPSSGTKTKKQKTKHSPLSIPPATSSSSNSSSFNLGAGSGSIKPPPDHLMLSPGALGGGGNSNDTTNSSFNSVDLDPDANLSNDGQDRAAEKSSPGGTGKAAPKADIFSLILNEKKSSLMRDPEVIQFLRDLMEKRGDKS